MILSSLTPNLMVEDVDQAIVFYQVLLGFTLNQTVPYRKPDGLCGPVLNLVIQR